MQNYKPQNPTKNVSHIKKLCMLKFNNIREREKYNCYNWELFMYFLKKQLEDISPYRGATDTPVLDFW